MAAKVPSLNASAVDDAGRFTQEWVSFFSRLTGQPGAIDVITPTGSPFVFKAPSAGALAIHDGAVSGVTLTRGRMTVAIAVGAVPPLSAGDVVTVTYSAPPTMAFIPRAV